MEQQRREIRKEEERVAGPPWPAAEQDELAVAHSGAPTGPVSNEVSFSVARFVGRINVYNDLNDPVVR